MGLGAIIGKGKVSKDLSSIKPAPRAKQGTGSVKRGTPKSKNSGSSAPKDSFKGSGELKSSPKGSSSRVDTITAGLMDAWGTPANAGVAKKGDTRADRLSKINRPWLDDESLADIREQQRANRTRERNRANELAAERAEAPASDFAGATGTGSVGEPLGVSAEANVDNRSLPGRAWDGIKGFNRRSREVFLEVSDHINDVTQDHIHGDNPNAIWNPDENRLEDRNGNSYWTGRPFND